MRDFFIDTANIESIKKIVGKLEDEINLNQIIGVTTNPNAFSKINEPKLGKWIETAQEISEFICSFRGDSKGEVHIQLPNSQMNIDEALLFAEYISKLPNDKITVGMKIPPYLGLLKNIDEVKKLVKTNVTGISDHATALKCISYGVDYVSLIPGRMEEVGIEAQNLMAYLFSANHNETKIISGSMRTLEQLIWTFQLNTIPTIGEKVFDLMFESENINSVLSIDYTKEFNTNEFSPLIKEESINLSVDFFKQMDQLGETAHKEFKEQLQH